MEKITILCGMANQEDAKAFMTGVAAEIKLRGYRIESMKTNDLVIFTKYTQTCFFYDKDAQPLNRVKADAIFGMEPYKQNLAVYLKESAPYNVGKGLVDYICECEENGPTAEANAKCDEAMEKYDKMIAKVRKTFKEHNVAALYPNELVTGSVKWHHRSDGGIDLMCCDGRTNSTLPEIKDVIFNNPATIVFWEDGTKTVVQCRENDIYDPEKGLAMAISKKIMGNKRDYYHTFKHWLKKV